MYLVRFHTTEYVDMIKSLSDKDGGDAGEVARFGKGGYEIASLAVGGVLVAVEELMSNRPERVNNAYCLVRPPGKVIHAYVIVILLVNEKTNIKYCRSSC